MLNPLQLSDVVLGTEPESEVTDQASHTHCGPSFTSIDNGVCSTSMDSRDTTHSGNLSLPPNSSMVPITAESKLLTLSLRL